MLTEQQVYEHLTAEPADVPDDDGHGLSTYAGESPTWLPADRSLHQHHLALHAAGEDNYARHQHPGDDLALPEGQQTPELPELSPEQREQAVAILDRSGSPAAAEPPAGPPISDAHVRDLLASAEEVAVDPAAVAAWLLVDVLSSQTPPAALTPREPVDLAELLGRRVAILDVTWQTSDDPAGPGLFALLDASSPDMEGRLLLVCRYRAACAQLLSLLSMGALPVEVVPVRSSRPTADGRLPVWLTSPPAPPPA